MEKGYNKMNNDLKLKLKVCLKSKNYNEYNKILRNEIINSFVSKIQKNKPEYLYSTLPELVEDVQKNLGEYEKEIILRFYEISSREIEEVSLADKLMDLYATKILKNVTD